MFILVCFLTLIGLYGLAFLLDWWTREPPSIYPIYIPRRQPIVKTKPKVQPRKVLRKEDL